MSLMQTSLFNSTQMKGMENSERSFWHQMYKAGMISAKAFALCFAHADVASRDGTDAGAVTLGGANANMHTSPMVYADGIDIGGWYGVRINAVYLKYEKNGNGTVDTRKRMDEEGGNTTNSQDGDEEATEEKTTIVKLNIDLDRANSRGVIVDSGTTESYFPTHMNYPFQEAFQTLMGFGFKSMVLGSSGIIPEIDYPTILIQLWAAPNVEDDGLMDENGVPLAGVAGEIDLYNPNDVFVSSHVVEKSSLASLSPRYTKMEGFNIVMLLKDSGEIDISNIFQMTL